MLSSLSTHSPWLGLVASRLFLSLLVESDELAFTCGPSHARSSLRVTRSTVLWWSRVAGWTHDIDSCGSTVLARVRNVFCSLAFSCSWGLVLICRFSRGCVMAPSCWTWPVLLGEDLAKFAIWVSNCFIESFSLRIWSLDVQGIILELEAPRRLSANSFLPTGEKAPTCL